MEFLLTAVLSVSWISLLWLESKRLKVMWVDLATYKYVESLICVEDIGICVQNNLKNHHIKSTALTDAKKNTFKHLRFDHFDWTIVNYPEAKMFRARSSWSAIINKVEVLYEISFFKPNSLLSLRNLCQLWWLTQEKRSLVDLCCRKPYCLLFKSLRFSKQTRNEPLITLSLNVLRTERNEILGVLHLKFTVNN